MGVLIFLAALMISLIRGTPCVISKTELRNHTKNVFKDIVINNWDFRLMKLMKPMKYFKGYSCLQLQQSEMSSMSSVFQVHQYSELQ